jgi:3-deoxy-D-manno-octulosonate 8-phosphate phosphatase (KDO 8-P phosphatase)
MGAAEKARELRLMAFDVDGVLTDGKLYFTSAGDEMKAFSALDGQGLKMLREAGVDIAIITGRSSLAVLRRAQDLGIETLLQGVEDKRAAMAGLLTTRGLDWRQAGYMGDDVVDLPLLRACGFSASVAEGHESVKKHVDYVARRPAGAGAAREVCEWILAAQGKLESSLAKYLST